MARVSCARLTVSFGLREVCRQICKFLTKAYDFALARINLWIKFTAALWMNLARFVAKSALFGKKIAKFSRDFRRI